MKPRIGFSALVMLLLTLSGGGSSLPTAVAQTAMYTVTDLGVLPGASDSYAYGINDRGQVVGESSGRAFLWQDGRMISLGALGDGNKGSARAINNNGQIVGTSTFSSTSLATHAFLFAVDATGNVISRTDLGTLPGHIGSIAHAINDMGRVAGYSGSQCCVAVYWDGGKITVLARLDTQNPVNWAAYAVNASGQMAGWEGSFAMAWDPAPRRLPANGEGYGINDTGQIVGAARAPGASHSTAFLLNPGAGAALNLGTLPGGVNSGAFDINNAGEVVGYSDGNLGTRAIRWVPSTANGTSGVMTDLNTLIPANSGWTLMRARAINNSGQIVGDGLRGNVNRGFLLTPAAPADTTPPTTTAAVSPMTNAAGWHTANATVTLTATDNSGGSDVKEIVYDTGGGPVSEAGATASVAITTEGTTSLSYFARDKAGNVEMPAKMLMIRLDKTAPTIAITAPTMTAYTLGQAVAASYSCMDGGSGSGVVTCVGPVPAGSALDTSAIGARTFTVDATDMAGNTATRSVSYTVGYGVCALYDQTRAHRAGSAVPIRVQLCDAAGANVSSPGIVLTALGVSRLSTSAPGVLEDTGNANADDTFRYDAALGGTGGYIFNLSTSGLGTGTYSLSFKAGADPTVQSVQFQVR